MNPFIVLGRFEAIETAVKNVEDSGPISNLNFASNNSTASPPQSLDTFLS